MHRSQLLQRSRTALVALTTFLLSASFAALPQGAAAMPAETAMSAETAVPAPTATTFAVDLVNLPPSNDMQAWHVMAERAADFDQYKVYDDEIGRRKAVVERFVSLSESQVSDLQPLIDKNRSDHADQEVVAQKLQDVLDRLGGRLSNLAIHNFKAGNDYSAIPIDVTGSGEHEQRRRNEQTFERVVDGSAIDFKGVKDQLTEADRIKAELFSNLQALEAEQQGYQSRLNAARVLAADFEARVQARAAAIEALSIQAVAAESSGLPLYRVGPFTVHENIAEPVALLLAAAAADGINFGGWGHRTIARQIELRRSHCGDSEWAIFDKPSSQCSPPTARPGRSQHERGLAIDFTENGSTLTRSSSGFVWLKQNAARYGLKNLPSEPWHWSTTGN